MDKKFYKTITILLTILLVLSITTIVKQQDRIDNIAKEIEVVDIFESEKGIIIQLEIEEDLHNYLLEY